MGLINTVCKQICGHIHTYNVEYSYKTTPGTCFLVIHKEMQINIKFSLEMHNIISAISIQLADNIYLTVDIENHSK